MSLSYESDIKPLFRDSDVEAMLAWFDLSEYEDVKANAEAIHVRLLEGSMPCDEPWPQEQTEKFKQWMDGGMAR